MATVQKTRKVQEEEAEGHVDLSAVRLPDLGSQDRNKEKRHQHHQGPSARGAGQGPPGGVVPPSPKKSPYPRFAEASWTPSLEVASLAGLVLLLLPPTGGLRGAAGDL